MDPSSLWWYFSRLLFTDNRNQSARVVRTRVSVGSARVVRTRVSVCLLLLLLCNCWVASYISTRRVAGEGRGFELPELAQPLTLQ